MRLRAFALGLLTAVAAPRLLAAQTGAEFLVNSYTTGVQRYGVVAAHPNGDFAIAWTSYDQDGSGAGIFTRRFRRDGTPAGGEIRVNTYTTSDQSFASLGMDADGAFVVVWQSRDGSNLGVFGQRFAADGDAVGGEFRVNSYTTGYQGFPAVAAADNGAFVVTWTSSDGSSGGVFARRFDASGQRAGGEFRVNSETGGFQSGSAAAMLPDGGFAVAWHGFGSGDPSAEGIFGQLYDVSGQPVGGQFAVNETTTGRQFSPSVASTGTDGGFVITWLGNDKSYYGIFAQRFDAAGGRMGGEIKLDTFDGNQSRPYVAVGRRGNFTVVWNADFQDGDGVAVVGRRVDASGRPRGSEFVVNTYTTYNQSLTLRPSAIASDERGTFIVTWHGAGDGSLDGVFARRFGARPAAPDGP